MNIGNLTKTKITTFLNQAKEAGVYFTLFDDNDVSEPVAINDITPDTLLDITNSDMGCDRLSSVFRCSPNPYTNILYMIENACKRNSIPKPERLFYIYGTLYVLEQFENAGSFDSKLSFSELRKLVLKMEKDMEQASGSFEKIKFTLSFKLE